MKKLSIKKQSITHTELYGVFDTVDNNIVMLNVGPNENNSITFDSKQQADGALMHYQNKVKKNLDMITLICKELEEGSFDGEQMHEGYGNFQSSFSVSKKIIGTSGNYEKYLETIGVAPQFEGGRGKIDSYSKYNHGILNKYGSSTCVQSDYGIEPAKAEFKKGAFGQMVYMNEISRRISTLEIRCLYSDPLSTAVVEEQLKELDGGD